VATFTLDPFLHDGRLEPAAVRSAVLAGGGSWGPEVWMKKLEI